MTVCLLLTTIEAGGEESADIFDSLAIAKAVEYQKYRNQSHVIYIDFSEMDDACDSYEEYISNIKELLCEDLQRAYPQVEFRKEKRSPAEDLNRELMLRFSDMLKREPKLGYVYRLAKESERMLQATQKGM